LDLRFYFKTPVYCFHSDFSFQRQYQQNWGPVPPIWGTLQITQMTFEFWDHSGTLRNPE
jgi:pyridoxine/pyridoxamine 5'-phosphate oxidase